MTINTWGNTKWTPTALDASTVGISPFLLLLKLLTVTLFCQIWFPVYGFTVRLEDLITIALLVTLLLPALKTSKLRYDHSPLNIPLVLWAGVLLLGVIITLLSSFDSVTQKDALINGIRLILALGLFFVIDWHPAPAEKKINAVTSMIVFFSFVTTAVTLLQMGYWDGWLPIALPEVLTTFKEGANTDSGRELFALYLGDTGSHTWSAALAMQALLVWLLGRHAKTPWQRGGAWLYFCLLIFILIRISVRNSILGLFIAVVCLELIQNQNTRNISLRAVRPLLIISFVSILLYALFSFAPDSYFIDRVRQAIPTFENGRLVVSRASNVYGRFDYWATALNIFFESPFIGGGFYSYQALSGSYGIKSVIHAHNSYLQTLAELGIIGVCALGLLMGTIIYYLARTHKVCMINRTAALWWEFTVASVIFLFFSMIFANTLWFPNYITFRMILLGVLASVVRGQIQWHR